MLFIFTALVIAGIIAVVVLILGSEMAAPFTAVFTVAFTVVSPSQTDLLFQALQKHNIPSKRYLVEGAAHGGIYWNQKEVLDIITTFFDSYLKVFRS